MTQFRNEIMRPATIVKEGFRGASYYGIQDKMLTERKLICFGNIDDALSNDLCLKLLYLEDESPGTPITLYINSPGGAIGSGLALYDVMQMITSPVETVCLGQASSMGAILFAAGKRRFILPHSSVMIHDPLVLGGPGGNALEIQKLGEELMATRKIIARILANHTGCSLQQIYAKTKKETVFCGQEAVDFGLADEVLTSPPSLFRTDRIQKTGVIEEREVLDV